MPVTASYGSAPDEPAMTPHTAQAIASNLATLAVDATADALLCLPAVIAP